MTLLIAVVFTARLTPRTKLPFAFDDMVINTLGGVAFIEQTNAKCSISDFMAITDATSIMQFVRGELNWVPLGSIDKITKAARDLSDMAIETHYVALANPEMATFSSALINLIKEQDGLMRVQICKDSKKVYGAYRVNYFHSVSESFAGLSTTGFKTLTSEGVNPDHFHLRCINRLLSAIVEVRASPKNVLGNEPALAPAGFDINKVITDSSNLVNAIAESYKKIVEAFKTVSNEEIKEKLTGEGFAEYSAKSRYLRSVGIPASYWNTYKTNFMKMTGIASNPKVKPEIETLLKMAEFIMDNAWNTNDLTYDSGKGGSCSNFVCLTRYDSVVQMYHIIATVVDGTFLLAPDVWIYTKYDSVAGGILETTKIVTKRMPRNITQADAKAVNAMMLLTSVDVMQENFGVPKTLPPFKEMTDL